MEPARRFPRSGMQPAAALVRRPPVIVRPETTLRDAARRMDAEEVSAVLVDLGDGQHGIVTDRDLRSQVVAGRVSADEPVTAAMSTPVIAVAADETGADVMLMMLDNDVRHVVVFSPRSEVLGVIVAVDLVAAETRAPFVLRRAIATARNKRELQETVTELRSTVIALWRADISPAQISEVISAVTDALVRRVIELAIETEGPPPADFCWMALGSHGRREPVPSSDADSGMAWRDAPEDDPLKSGARRALASNQTKNYMSGIASSVSDCIRVLGWSLDAHGVTASGFASSSIEDWRQSIATWLTKPTDNKVLIAISILLDGRIVYGDRGLDVKRILFEAGDREVLEQWMLRLALAAKPPTGFMRNIVVEGSGKRRGTFDIKHGGLLPIVDLARYAALKGGIALNATLPRLRASADEGIFNQATARVLEEAYELFSALRFEHQVDAARAGRRARRPPEPGRARSAHPPLPPGRIPGGGRRAALARQRTALAAIEVASHGLQRTALVSGCRVPAGRDPLAGGRVQRDRPGDDRTGSGLRRDHLLRHRDRQRRHRPLRRRALRAGAAQAHAGLGHDPDPRPPRGGPGGGARRSTEHIDDLLDALTGRPIVAHVAEVERSFLEAALSSVGTKLRNPIVDTAALDRELRCSGGNGPPPREPIGLGDMVRSLGLPVHRPHHADGDALTTAQAFIALATHLDGAHAADRRIARAAREPAKRRGILGWLRRSRGDDERERA